MPVRPTQQECPREVFKAQEQRDWVKTVLFLKPNPPKNLIVTLKPGPLISVVQSDFLGGPPPGSLFRGHVYFAEDGRVVIRYTEVELASGERVPVCFAVVHSDDRTINPTNIVDRTENSVTLSADQVANSVRVLPD